MGRYQWQLFALCGGGWMADNLWLQVRIPSPSTASRTYHSLGCRPYTTATEC